MAEHWMMLAVTSIAVWTVRLRT